MADLTSTLTITGTVNGRSVSISHTFTLEDVYDAGSLDEEGVGREHLIAARLAFNQNNPNYLACVNKDAFGVTEMVFTTSGSTISFTMNPGAIVCLTSAEGTGLLIDTSTGTGITLEDLTFLISDSVEASSGAILPFGRISTIAAFQATT